MLGCDAKPEPGVGHQLEPAVRGHSARIWYPWACCCVKVESTESTELTRLDFCQVCAPHKPARVPQRILWGLHLEPAASWSPDQPPASLCFCIHRLPGSRHQSSRAQRSRPAPPRPWRQRPYCQGVFSKAGGPRLEPGPSPTRE
uniref:Collagen IV NC1 domain-containing protein n=1 Tax=Macrostomum lignano TaxID=282301 RepID=A0A1I8JRA5_9PLAT